MVILILELRLKWKEFSAGFLVRVGLHAYILIFSREEVSPHGFEQ